MKIVGLALGQLRTNAYLAVCEITRKALVIDPADDGQYLIKQLQELGAQPVAIVATHGHFDHVLAALELKLIYDIPFLIHKKDEFLLKQTRSSARHWLGLEVDPPPPVDEYLSEDKDVTFGIEKLQVIATPGHTPGSVCLYSEKAGLMFTGDTLFANGAVGRTDFKYSSATDLKQSLQSLFRYPEETMIYPGHGQESKLEWEMDNHTL